MMIKKNIQETNNDLKEVSRNKQMQDKISKLQDCMKYVCVVRFKNLGK